MQINFHFRFLIALKRQGTKMLIKLHYINFLRSITSPLSALSARDCIVYGAVLHWLAGWYVLKGNEIFANRLI